MARPRLGSLLSIDRADLRVGRALWSLPGLAAIVAIVSVMGTEYLAVAIAYILVTASAGAGFTRQRLSGMARMTAMGVVFGFAALLSIEQAGVVAAVIFAAAYLTGLSSQLGEGPARRGVVLMLWLVLALTIGRSVDVPWVLAASFGIGGIAAMAVTGIRTLVDRGRRRDESDESDPGDGPALPRLMAARHGRTGQFALVRAAVIALGVLLGYWWFSSYPLWVTITLLVIVRPDPGQTVEVAVPRLVGTAAGIAVAELLLAGIDAEGARIVAFASAAFGTVLFYSANYFLFVASLSAFLVLAIEVAGGDSTFGGGQRLLATVVGGVVGITVVGLWSRASPPDRR